MWLRYCISSWLSILIIMRMLTRRRPLASQNSINNSNNVSVTMTQDSLIEQHRMPNKSACGNRVMGSVAFCVRFQQATSEKKKKKKPWVLRGLDTRVRGRKWASGPFLISLSTVVVIACPLAVGKKKDFSRWGKKRGVSSLWETFVCQGRKHVQEDERALVFAAS